MEHFKDLTGTGEGGRLAKSPARQIIRGYPIVGGPSS